MGWVEDAVSSHMSQIKKTLDSHCPCTYVRIKTNIFQCVISDTFSISSFLSWQERNKGTERLDRWETTRKTHKKQTNKSKHVFICFWCGLQAKEVRGVQTSWKKGHIWLEENLQGPIQYNLNLTSTGFSRSWNRFKQVQVEFGPWLAPGPDLGHVWSIMNPSLLCLIWTDLAGLFWLMSRCTHVPYKDTAFINR